MYRRAFLLASTGAAAAIAGCSGGDEDDEAGDDMSGDRPMEATVSINEGEFDPMRVHIAVGGTVTWENNSEESRRIEAAKFESGSVGWFLRASLEPGESSSHTFESDGRYDFVSENLEESEMCGRVRVGTVDERESLPCE